MHLAEHRRWITRSLAVLAAAAACAVLLYARPLAATPAAQDAMRSDAAVAVVDRATEIELVPRARHRDTGLVFYPGARVDSRAYLPLLRPVAEAGYPVVVLKPPFGMAILHAEQGQQVLGRAQRWVVGGHSLGGPAAARLATHHPDQVHGLLLWASYPDIDLRGARDLDVTSVYGTRDGLSTPADVRRAPLPPGTEFVAVQGAVHTHFGDYGPQSGDGQPATSRADAQRQIVAATLDCLRRIDAQP
ncbi:alpha/beta hydrolase [Saccharopolyspora hordei]|uniref:Pimeloyl-ACP methyl ester carboxylesterase n=1 Tax=Saccharopolyspora hordei TaxID=1838 RepID=A0A853AJI7_9PSEU|nr:alpha/beta hydrolase [Saccharopolyspora hordei]NYI84188.1 pimeloyl-ACP methyl ester carboxylesterase [Saccharopolyspora hordei]